MNGNPEDRQDVIVFWDFDSCPTSSSAASAISTYEMVKNIRSTVAIYGPLKSIRLYWDYGAHPVPSTTLHIRSELSASGVTLIDCPAEGRKGAATKKMLVDMLIHAWDSPLPFTFVVIAGDRDLAYALAMLRMKSYPVILISPAGSHPDLTSQASIQLDWSRTILGINGTSNEDNLFEEEVPNPIPSHAPPISSDSTRPEQGTFTFRSDFPPSSSRYGPGLAHKASAFSSSYDHGLNVFGGPRFSSPKSSLALGDGPLFPRPLSTIQKPLRSRSGSLPDFLRPAPFANKGKNKTSEPEDIELHAPPPPSSGSKLRSSTSVFDTFEPFDDDDDGLPTRQLSPEAAIPKPALSSSSSSSFEKISRPTRVNSPELVEQPRKPLEDKSPQLSNEPRAAVTVAVPQTDTNPRPSVAPPPLPQPVVVPSGPSKAAPSQNAASQRPRASGNSKPNPTVASKPLPRAWVPLIDTLRRHNGVLSRSTVAPVLLKYYPDAFKTAGVKSIKSYLKVAILAGIVLKPLPDGKPKIRLTPSYFP